MGADVDCGRRGGVSAVRYLDIRGALVDDLSVLRGCLPHQLVHRVPVRYDYRAPSSVQIGVHHGMEADHRQASGG